MANGEDGFLSGGAFRNQASGSPAGAGGNFGDITSGVFGTSDGANSAVSGDSVTQTTYTSWFQRLGQALIGVLVGLVAVLGASGMMFWNEHRAAQTARSLGEGAGLVVEADSSRIDPAQAGKLVHVSGDLAVGQPVSDPAFGISAQTPHLVRRVEMYQWKQESRTETRKHLGGGEEQVTTYTYARGWSDQPIDSSRFHNQNGHSNPAWRYRPLNMVAQDATLGAFRLGEPVLRKVPADQPVTITPDLAAQAANQAGVDAQAADNSLYLGDSPDQPRIGDYRISFLSAPVGPLSVVGRQDGRSLAAYPTEAGDQILLVEPGTVAAAAMFKTAEDENRTLTWILRAVGLFIMFIGFVLIFNPLKVVADLVPLVGDVLGVGVGLVALLLTLICGPVIIALAWLAARPLISVLAIGVAVLAVMGIKRMAQARRAPSAVPRVARG